MSDRHVRDIERAAHLAHRAATTGRRAEEDRLTRFLYHRWWLGRRPSAGHPRAGHPAGPPAQSGPPLPPWRTWSEGWEGAGPPSGTDLLRVYVACAPHTALHTIATITDAASHWSHPWLLSSRAMHQAVPSPDATVLYLPTAALEDLREDLQALVHAVRPFLATSAPLLTLHVARGIGLAQNPPGRSSFGEHHCRLIASGVLASLNRPGLPMMRTVLGRFTEHQIDPRRPYRQIGADWQWHRDTAAA